MYQLPEHEGNGEPLLGCKQHQSIEYMTPKEDHLKEAFHSTTVKLRKLFPDRAMKKRLLQMHGNKLARSSSLEPLWTCLWKAGRLLSKEVKILN